MLIFPGSLILVPLYIKFGRRPVMLGSMVLFVAGLIGSSQCKTYGTLMACRIIQCFGSGVCEAIPVQLVNDIFFIHERGKRLGYYTVALCLGATGPLYAGYMLAGGYSWRLFFYVVFAFSMVLLVTAFFFVEETLYHRETMKLKLNASVKPEQTEKEPDVAHTEINTTSPARKSFVSTLKLWSVVDHDAPFFSTIARSFTYFLVPSVFWVVTTYGIYIGLGALAFNFTFPIKITSPPYNWTPVRDHISNPNSHIILSLVTNLNSRPAPA
jgi:MFS family permease